MAGLEDRSNEGEMVRLVPMIEFFTMNMSDPQGASPWRATATRWETLMEVPPMSDFVPGCDASAWNGIGAPRGTPTEIIERLNREINTALPIEGSKYALRTSAVSRALITE